MRDRCSGSQADVPKMRPMGECVHTCRLHSAHYWSRGIEQSSNQVRRSVLLSATFFYAESHNKILKDEPAGENATFVFGSCVRRPVAS